jgi:SOS-response transcriptional repressor LexA
MPRLTNKQREVLDLVVQLTRVRGYPPTPREMCHALSLGRQAVADRMRGLERKGWLTIARRRSRGVALRSGFNVLVSPTRCHCGCVSFGVPSCPGCTADMERV